MKNRTARAGIVLRVACLCLVVLLYPEARGSAGARERVPVPAIEPAPARPAAMDGFAKGAHAFLTVLCKFTDVPDEPEPPAFFERLLGADYPGLDHYWREVSYGQMSLAGSKVVGWVTLPAGKGAYLGAAGAPDFARLAHDCARSGGINIDPGKYFGLNLVFNAELATTPHGGQMCLDLATSTGCYGLIWIWPSWLRSQASWAHEMGHALGLEHTGSDPGRQYGNVWDVMSEDGACEVDSEFGRLAQHAIAYHKDRLGWIPASAKLLLTVPGERTFKLAALAQPARPEDAFLLAQIPIDGSDRHFYTLEARMRVGYDRHLPSDAVLIHEVDLRMPRAPRVVPAWVRWQSSPGDGAAAAVFRDRQHGITVAVERQDADGFIITVRSTAPELPNAAAMPGLPRSLVTAIERARQADLAAPATAGDEAPRPRDAALAQIPRSQLALAVDEMGRRHALWIEASDDGSDAFYAVRPPDQTWGGAVRIDPGADPGTMAMPALAAGPGGGVYAAWSQMVQGRWLVHFAVHPGDLPGWTRTERISSIAAGDAWVRAIAVDGRSRAYVLWRERYVCGGRVLSEISLAMRSEDGRWQPIEKVDANLTSASLGGFRLVVNTAGDVYAEWQELTPQGAATYASFRQDGGPWSSRWEVARGAELGASAPGPVTPGPALRLHDR